MESAPTGGSEAEAASPIPPPVIPETEMPPIEPGAISNPTLSPVQPLGNR